MTERKMTRKQIEKAIRNTVEYFEPFFIGTAGVSIVNGAIITKIDNAIVEMGLQEKAETACHSGEWYIARKHH